MLFKINLIRESLLMVSDIIKLLIFGLMQQVMLHTAMFEELESDNQGFNPLFMMSDSGARGSQDQIKQLAGMRGLMAKPKKSMTGFNW